MTTLSGGKKKHTHCRKNNPSLDARPSGIAGDLAWHGRATGKAVVVLVWGKALKGLSSHSVPHPLQF
jgi:hypothetical protein